MPPDKSPEELVAEFATFVLEKIEKICNKFKTIPTENDSYTITNKTLTTNKGQNPQRNNGDKEQEL